MLTLYYKDTSIEANKLTAYCSVKDIPIKRVKTIEEVTENDVFSGSVEMCLKILGRDIIPDYYPAWLKKHLYRKVWKSDKWLHKKLFVKPADKYKRFTGFKTFGTDAKRKKTSFLVF